MWSVGPPQRAPHGGKRRSSSGEGVYHTRHNSASKDAPAAARAQETLVLGPICEDPREEDAGVLEGTGDQDRNQVRLIDAVLAEQKAPASIGLDSQGTPF